MPIPDLGRCGAFPKVQVPTLVIWGMERQALLPIQLDGLDELVDDLRSCGCPTPAISRRGKRREQVAAALGPFLAGARGATAPGRCKPARSRSRSAARLAAVQALYQQEMEGTPIARLLHEFHDHRLGATIEDAQYAEAEPSFFDDVVTRRRRAPRRDRRADRRAAGRGLEPRAARQADEAILRAGAYELLARADVPVGSVITEYVDVAHAFYDKRESGFVNGLLDAIAKAGAAGAGRA